MNSRNNIFYSTIFDTAYYTFQGGTPNNLLLRYWTGTVRAGTKTISRHRSMNILLCAGTIVNQGNGFEFNYVTAPRKCPTNRPSRYFCYLFKQKYSLLFCILLFTTTYVTHWVLCDVGMILNIPKKN